MQYDGNMSEQDARKAARQDTCIGCLGALGVGLFDKKMNVNNKKEKQNEQ